MTRDLLPRGGMIMIRKIMDKISNRRLRESEDNLTYQEYLEITEERDDKDTYMEFLMKTKDVDRSSAEEQAKYHYDESRKIRLKEYDDTYYLDPRPELDIHEAGAILLDEVWNILKKYGEPNPDVDFKGNTLYYKVGEYQCSSELVVHDEGWHSGAGITVYDPEILYLPHQSDDVPPVVDRILDEIARVLDYTIDSYNKGFSSKRREWDDEYDPYPTPY